MPNAGYEFVSWSGDLSGSANPATLTMDSIKSITAHFVAQDVEPPRTIHKFSGTDKKHISVTLTAEDDSSGVDRTLYHLELKDGGVERGEGTSFMFDLEKVREIVYFSIDKNGT